MMNLRPFYLSEGFEAIALRAEKGGGALVKADTKLVCDGVKKIIWPRRQNTNLSTLGKAVHLLSLEMFLKLSTDGLKHM